jgi:multidrug resistance efflux pump
MNSPTPHPIPLGAGTANPAASRTKTSRKILFGLLVGLLVLGSAGGFWYWLDQQKYVYTDKASFVAPTINLTSTIPGVLKMAMVRDGDPVSAHQAVARVGDEMITSEIDGLVLKANRDIGAEYSPGQPVVTMIDPRELRVVARVEEDKGLKDVHAGQGAEFTVDAYGSQKFQGTVESVSNTSREGDVVFNISDKREEQEFEIKIAYDLEKSPPFQNGMSAKVWIIK